jgi:hypothetical protein
MKDGERHVVCFIVLAMLLSLIPAARGEWKERYAQNPPGVKQWYKDAQMNDVTWERLENLRGMDAAKMVMSSRRNSVSVAITLTSGGTSRRKRSGSKCHPTPSTGGNMLPIDYPPSSSTGRAKSCASIRPRKVYRWCNCNGSSTCRPP